MNQEKVLNEFTNLPPEAKKQVANFIYFLRKRYKHVQKRPRRTDLDKESFIGIWRNREDMKDSHGLLIADALITATAMSTQQPLVTKNQRDYRFIKGLDLRPYPNPLN